jgi:hypothetical protein
MAGQQQNEIDVILLDGVGTKGTKTGNNASWLCVCGFKRPLLGRSGGIKGPALNTVVECPHCHRVYFVVPSQKTGGRASQIRQLSPDEAPYKVKRSTRAIKGRLEAAPPNPPE